jgi:D-alanyl-D-alanine dipeptidase
MNEQAEILTKDARLVAIIPPAFDVELCIAYAGADNFTRAPVYARADAYLDEEAARLLTRAIELAAELGLRLRLFDAFRPTEAQWVLWNHTPDPDFLMPSRPNLTMAPRA